jgi:hypothetical protein
LSKLGSGKTITEENVIACIQEHCESKKQVKKETKKSSSKTINKQEKVKGSAMKKKVNGKQKALSIGLSLAVLCPSSTTSLSCSLSVTSTQCHQETEKSQGISPWVGNQQMHVSKCWGQTMTEKLTDNTLPLTPIQTDRIDSSPPMDLSPDVTQMHVEERTKASNIKRLK